MESVYISTIATDNGGAAVLSWMPSAGGAADAFVRSLAQIPDAEVGDAIVRLVFEHAENMFVRPSWWSGLPPEYLDALLNRASTACNPFIERQPDCLKPDGNSYAHWTVSVRRHRIAAGL
jgi:hypothetical protein